ncbi:MAG: BTAD domain-containing putative transcriptional regulator [Rubrivivax sp.]|nr:BTAD domain-containing putative transcriptional regulator [Rubrivivax sp.]
MDRAKGIDGLATAGATAAQLRLLGVPSLRRQDGSVYFLERLEAALLAHLLIEGPASRAEMAALLWPEVDAPRARGNLRQRLRRLKAAAGFDLLADADPLRLRADLAHDLDADDPALADGAGDAGAELLEGLDFAGVEGLHDWVLAARERVRTARRVALERNATQLEATGHVAAALRLAQRLLELDALDESVHRRVMRLHHARGDRAAALHAFQHCRDLLARELGVSPCRETRALAAEIESGAPLRAPAARPRPIALARPPRLIGRERELAALHDGWQRGNVVAVLGEAGVGKSRLIAELAAHQAPALSTGARPGDAQIAFALLTRLLRTMPGLAGADLPPWVRLQLGHLLPELGRPDSPGLNPLRLRQALVWVLGNLPVLHQGVLVIDDLQFADEATLEELPALLAADTQPPLRWLLVARGAEIPPLLRSTLEGGDPVRATVVRIESLAVHDVQMLLDSLSLEGLDAAAWAAPLHRHTGGNPMFILQTLMSMGDGPLGASPLSSVAGLPLPGRVGELVERRISQLSAPARELAQVAALAGQDFNAKLALHVLDRHAADLSDAWRELEAAQVLRDEAFAHDLIFEATLRSVLPDAAGPWRGRIAAHMAAAGGPLPHIAAHWQAAGQWALAGRAFSVAAAGIRRQMRQLEEVALLREAVACHAAAFDAGSEVEAWKDLYLAQWRRKNRAGIREAVTHLQALQSTSPRARMWALAFAGQLGFDERQDEASLGLVTQAREQAQALGETEVVAWASSVESSCHALRNRPQQALEGGRRCMALADALPRSIYSLGAVFNVGGALELCGYLAESAAALGRAEDAFRALDDPAAVADVQCLQSILAYHTGRLEEAAELLTRGRRALGEINGGVAEVHTPVIFQGRYWRDQGRLAEALALLEDGHQRTAEKGEVNLHAGICIELGLTYLVLGQPHRAQPLVDKPRHVPKLQVRLEGLLLEAELARLGGKPELPLLDAALALVPLCPRSERYRWRVQSEMSTHLPADEAVPLLERIVQEAQARQTWSHAGPAWVRLIEALLRDGRHAAAAQQSKALSSELERRPPMGFCAGEYHWALCRAFDAVGDATARDALLRRAVAWINETARHQVPDAFRDSFLNRNPFNRQLRAMAARHGALAV